MNSCTSNCTSKHVAAINEDDTPLTVSWNYSHQCASFIHVHCHVIRRTTFNYSKCLLCISERLQYSGIALTHAVNAQCQCAAHCSFSARNSVCKQLNLR